MRTAGIPTLALAAGLTIAGLAGTCRADGASRAAAEALFQKGRDAMSRSDYDAACAAFEESNRLDPAPGTMANLANCEEQRGHLSAAWQGYEDVAQRLPEGDPRRAVAEQRVAAIQPRLSNLTVSLAPGSASDVSVIRDSIELRGASLGTSLPTDPGPHRVVVSEPGRVDAVYDVFLREGETRALVVAVGAPVSGAPTVASPPPAPSSTAPNHSAPSGGSSDLRPLGYVIGGVGVAGIGTALALGGVVLGKKHTVSEHCNGESRACDQTGLDAASSGRTLSTISTVSFIVGAAATGVGLYLILGHHGAEPATTMDVSALPGGGALDVSGVF